MGIQLTKKSSLLTISLVPAIHRASQPHLVRTWTSTRRQPQLKQIACLGLIAPHSSGSQMTNIRDIKTTNTRQVRVRWKMLTNRKGALSVDTAHALGKLTKIEIVWAADTVSQSQRRSLTTTMHLPSNWLDQRWSRRHTRSEVIVMLVWNTSFGDPRVIVARRLLSMEGKTSSTASGLTRGDACLPMPDYQQRRIPWHRSHVQSASQDNYVRNLERA